MFVRDVGLLPSFQPRCLWFGVPGATGFIGYLMAEFPVLLFLGRLCGYLVCFFNCSVEFLVEAPWLVFVGNLLVLPQCPCLL